MNTFEEKSNFDEALDDVFGQETETNTETPTQPNKPTQQPEENGEENEEDEEFPEQISDEDMENVFKPSKKSKKKDNKVNKDINGTNKDIGQEQQPNNNPQDLVDKDGKIIAKAGAERRIFEENQRMRKEMQQFHAQVLPTIRQQYQAMENELANYKGVVEGLKAQDLSPQDIQSGLDFARQWKKDPKNVVKFLLTTLQSNGIDVDIEGMNSSVQASAIKQMIDEKFRPFMEERENANRIAQQEQEVENEYNNFIQKYPDATIHDKTLGFMIRKDPSLSPEIAYYQLKNYYLRKGLDFNIPLEAYAQKNQQTTTPVQGIPQTRVVNDQVAVNKVRQRVARSSDSFKDIIRGSMEEAGIV